MASVTLTISSPILSGSDVFDVEIKNSFGAPVYTGTATNAPFNVTGLTPDNYVAYYTYGENTSQYCFTINPCGCPDVQDAELVERVGMPGNYDFVLTFDMSLYTPTPECAFTLLIEFGGGVASHVGFSTLAAMTNIGGDIWTWTYFVGTYSAITYSIFKSVAPAYPDLEVCTGATAVAGEPCHGPLTTNSGTVAAPVVGIRVSSGTILLDIDYTNCGVDCATVTWNYLQLPPIITGGSLDSGTFTDTVVCSPLGSSNHVLTPAPTPYAPAYYQITGTDCCGNTYSTTVTCTCAIAISDIIFEPPTVVNRLDLTINSCGGGVGDCNEISVSYMQTAVVAGNTPDSGTFVITIPCGGLPYAFSRTFTPAPSTHPTVSQYYLDFTNCCNGYIGNAAVGVLK